MHSVRSERLSEGSHYYRLLGEERGPVALFKMNDSTLICFILYFFAALRVYVAAEKLPIVECNVPVAATVEVDSNHRYFPYYVRLHRCQGSWKQVNPKTKKCVPTGLKEIKLEVYSFVRRRFELRSMYNHTSCRTECTTDPNECNLLVQKWNEENCGCECLYNDAPPPENVMKRKKRHRWNKHLCNYECDRSPASCSRKKVLNKVKCSCVCKPFYKRICDTRKEQMDPDTCECIEAHQMHKKGCPSSSTHILVLALLGLAVIVIIVLFAWIFHLKRKSSAEDREMAPETSSVASTQTPKTSTDTITDRGSDCESAKVQINFHESEV